TSDDSAATTYVIAAHHKASFAPACSALLWVMFLLSNHANARLDASNSTGSVTNENIVVMANAATPMASTYGLPEKAIISTPMSSTHVTRLEATLTMGTMAERNCSQEYALACCTACPHSWAATAAAATLRPLYTSGLRFTVRLAGL